MKKLSHQNKIKKLIEIVRRMDADGPVCDSVLTCEGWDYWAEDMAEAIWCRVFKFCPWCSAKLDWEWPRLRR